jgi:hypothetical protein
LLSLAISAGGVSGISPGLGTPWNVNWASGLVPSTSTVTIWPAFSSPNGIFSDRWSSISRWIVRRRQAGSIVWRPGSPRTGPGRPSQIAGAVRHRTA